MTTTTTKRFSFDRDEVAEFEKPVGDDRHQVWLSPYAIPGDFDISRTVDGLQINICYFGDEPAGELRPLDDAASPALFVRYGRYTRKVMAVWVPLAGDHAPAAGTPADAVPLIRGVADRLTAAAGSRVHPAEQMSLRLIGDLLRTIAPQMAEVGPPASGPPPSPVRLPHRMSS